jgi:AcrR family transcriptional regulator
VPKPPQQAVDFDASRTEDRSRGSGAPELTARGRATRLRILEAAARLIHLRGVTATRVDEVLAAANAGKSQFYHYFDHKEDLVAQTLELQMERESGRQAGALSEDDPWTGLRRWFDDLLTYQRERALAGGCPVGSMAAEVADRDPVLAGRLATYFAGQRRLLREHLIRMQSQGRLNPGADPEALATLVVTVIQGGQLVASAVKDEQVLRQALEQAYAHVWSWRSRAPA